LIKILYNTDEALSLTSDCTIGLAPKRRLIVRGQSVRSCLLVLVQETVLEHGLQF